MQPVHASSGAPIWIIDCSAPQGDAIQARSATPLRALVLAPGPREALSVLKSWSAAQTGEAAWLQPVGAPVALLDWQQTAYDDWELLAVLPELGPMNPVRLVRAAPPMQAGAFPAGAIRIEPAIEAGFLDEQFGVYPKKTVPDALRPALWDGSAHSYAVIDAACVPNLPERLAATKMRHSCLFDGRAAQQLGAAAPWLVELAPDEKLLRDLFTRSADQVAEGDGPTGLFLRSDNDFSEVKAHLRQFVRLRDESGDWAYFRFWEGPYLFALFDALTRGEFVEFGRLFVSRKAVIGSFGYMDLYGCWHEACLNVPPGSSPPAPANSVPVLTAQLRAVFRSIRAQNFVRRLHLHLNKILREEAATSTPLSEQEVLSLVREARSHGLTLEKSIADYTQARMMTPQGFGRAPWFAALKCQNLHQLDFAQAVLKRSAATWNP